MSETARMWMEITFNVAYLIVVWGLVAAMVLRRDEVEAEDRPVARRIRWAFALLALGDTGHVGFRVLAYALGDMEATVNFLGIDAGLVGLGALSTAVTVTFFYVLVLDTWRARFRQRYGPFAYLLLASAAARLVLMLPAANEWNSVVPPQPWSLYRNLPLVVLGLGTAYLILRDARRAGDRAFLWIGIMILVSYAMYAPVILFVQQAPLVGMLMIPKTVAYVVIGFIAYASLYRAPARRERSVLGDASQAS
ncbi:MAG: hypothetical protein P8129_09130 [Anaerolineae bacterium]|jgi:hypothetical protein